MGSPDLPAVVDGDSVLTWADLDRRARAVGEALARAGVPRGGLVALTGEPSAGAIVALLGIVRAGMVAAPIPGRLTAAERARIMALLRPTAMIDARVAARPGELPPDAVRLGSAVGGSAADGSARAGDSATGGGSATGSGAAAAGRVLDTHGVVVLTSGTTADPKGVILPASALDASAEAWLEALPPATGWLLALGLGHVAGIGVVWRAIARRVPVRIADAADPAAILAGLGGATSGSPDAEAAASHVSLVPAQLHRLLDAVGDAPPPSTLRAVLLGGGAIDPALVSRAVAAGWPVVPTYGLSEAGSGVTALPASEAGEAPGSAGWPLPGVGVSIDEPDGDGVGEIVVRSPAAFRGYLDDEPRADGEPIRTGDLGRLDDSGRLYVIGRRTDRIVRGGENIAPSEVERVLVAHPAVADAAVVARPDAIWGQVPVAAIVPRPGASRPDDASLERHCRSSLAGFKVPAGFAWLEALPRTAGGKLRRAAVRTMLDGPLPGVLARPDGVRIGWRTAGTGSVPVILLHGTLSTAGQLDRLAAELARRGDLRVHTVDRRASGTSRVPVPRPIDVAIHVADLIAVLDHLGIDRGVLVGLSYGGVLALETAARHPRRVRAVVAWEPPFGPVADASTRARFAALAAATEAAHRTRGPAAAAETFLRAVAGDAAWERLSDRGRAFIEGEGDGALADAALTGVDARTPARIAVPTTLLTGGGSEPFYGPIARRLGRRIPGVRQVTLDGLGHAAPLTDPARMAAVILDSLEVMGPGA